MAALLGAALLDQPQSQLVALRVEAWCDDSIRIHMNPGSTTDPGVPPAILDDLPGALTDDCATGGGSREIWNGLLSLGAMARMEPSTIVSSGNLRATVFSDGSLQFVRAADNTSLFSVQTPRFDAHGSTLPGFWVMAFNVSAPPERVYGLGQVEGTSGVGCPTPDGTQRGLPLERNGLKFDLSTSKFHVSIPWMVSSNGYGLLLNLPGAGAVSVGKAGGSSWSVTAQLQLDVWVTTTSAGTDRTRLDGLYARYADATGHATPLSPNTLRFWQSRLRYRTSDEALTVARRYGALNISLGVLVIDFHNQRVDGDFVMEPDCYPDVTALVNDVRDSSDAELMVSLWPFIRAGSKSHANLTAAGCVATGSNVDPTSAACRTLMWDAYIKPNYFDHGVRHFWLDETDFMKDGLSCGGKDFCGRWWHNAWLQTFADGLAREGVPPLILTRGWWPGAQRYGGVLWSSDIFSSFAELRAQVPEGIAASLSGVPWWTTDVGGFGCPTSPHNDTDPYMQELIQRWYQFGALCPIFRTHGCRAGEVPPQPSRPADICVQGQGPQGSCGANEIWSFGPQVQPVLEKYIQLRNVELAPYLRELADNVTANGALTMRALAFEFPADKQCIGISDQFLLGPKYLVAPVVEQGAVTRRMYFPAGASWCNYWTGETVEGGIWRNVSAPIDTLPLFRRCG